MSTFPVVDARVWGAVPAILHGGAVLLVWGFCGLPLLLALVILFAPRGRTADRARVTGAIVGATILSTAVFMPGATLGNLLPREILELVVRALALPLLAGVGTAVLLTLRSRRRRLDPRGPDDWFLQRPVGNVAFIPPAALSAANVLQEGSQILGAVLGTHGWRFVAGAAGVGSGGRFASGDFVLGNRRLELHVRRSLGLVTYHLGDLSLSHEAYMEALLSRRGASSYPGFSDDPLDGFRHLAEDLSAHCTDFIAGTGDEFVRCVARAKEMGKRSGFTKISPTSEI